MPLLIGMERVEAMKILGLSISTKLKVATQVQLVLAHDLDEHCLQTVCKATTINRMQDWHDRFTPLFHRGLR